MITIAHLSDLHLDGGQRATERAERVVSFLRAAPGPVDVVLVTGDIADHGRPDEYRQARLLLDLPAEVLVLPGNHDVRPAFAVGLLDAEPSESELNRSVRHGEALFLLCDSTVPGQDAGLLSERTLAWLDATLAADSPELPAFVCFHHPPVDLHAPLIDRIRQAGEERLAALLARHPRVAAVLCGHAHAAAVTNFAGVPLCVAPGVASTVRLPLEGGPAVDLDLPPAIAFHVLDDRRRLTTHYRVLT